VLFRSRGIHAELIDLRSIKPWDSECVLASIRKTRCLVVADAAWTTGGVAAEVIAAVTCGLSGTMQVPAARVCLPDVPAPMSAALEKIYYRNIHHIVAAVEKVLADKERACLTKSRSSMPEPTMAD